jgi:oxygen-dependent protoporphyrinogen oxidase
MKTLRPHADVGVVGGGIAGLAAAWLLKRRGVRVILFEKEGEAGGNIRSRRQDGYLIERGPYCFLKSSRWVWRLVRDAGLESELVGATDLQSRRFIYKDGRLHAVPLDPVSFARTRFFSTRAKLRLLAEPFLKGGAGDRETAYEFFRRRFGEEFADHVAASFVSGVYAGDIHTLGARAAFGKFWNFEREAGSMILGALRYTRRMKRQDERRGLHPRKGMWTFSQGLGFITQWLARELEDRVVRSFPVDEVSDTEGGVIVRSGERSFGVRRAIVAAPPSMAAEFLRSSFPAAAAVLESMPMAPVAVVQWSPGPGTDAFPEGFGFLVPPRLGMKTLGTIFYSHIFPHFHGEGRGRLYGTFMGGAHHPGAVDLGDEEILGRMLMEHDVILGKTQTAPAFFNIVRHPKAIAQLLPDHPEKVERARGILGAGRKVLLAGGYLTGVGMDHAVESAYRAAAEIAGDHDGAVEEG